MTESDDLTPADVARFLAPHGIGVQELPADTSTAVLAARALNTEVGAIVKSLLFEADGKPLLVLVSGDRKVNDRALARELGVKKVRLAPAETTRTVTGYAVGGVPPVAHRVPLRVLMDRSLMERSVVYAAAGASHALFPIEPARLLELARAEPTDSAR